MSSIGTWTLAPCSNVNMREGSNIPTANVACGAIKRSTLHHNDALSRPCRRTTEVYAASIHKKGPSLENVDHDAQSKTQAQFYLRIACTRPSITYKNKHSRCTFPCQR